MNEIANELSSFVKRTVREKKFNIISLSQGGLIARLYINKEGHKRVKKCITLCTPHNGSVMAYMTNLPGFIELRPKSKFLKKLNEDEKSKMKYYSVYTPLDLTVFPGINGKFEEAKKNKRVLAPLHMLAFWWKPTLYFILESLNG